MMRHLSSIPVLGCLLFVFTLAGFCQAPDVQVSLDGGAFQPGTETHVHLKINPKRVGPFKNPTAFYEACSVKSETDNPTSSPESFCALSEHTKLVTSKAEPLRGYPERLQGVHTFTDPLKIPAETPDPKIWIVLYLDTGFHRRYGQLSLTRHCEQPPSGGIKTGKVSCAFYTAAGWASRKAGQAKPQ